MRKAASANEAKRLPVPASDPVTAYSLTKAWNYTIKKLIIAEIFMISEQKNHQALICV